MRWNLAAIQRDLDDCCQRTGQPRIILPRPAWYLPRRLGWLPLPPAVHEAAVAALVTMLRAELTQPRVDT